MAISISSRERCRSSSTFLIVFGGLIFLSSLSLAGCEIHRTRTSRVARATSKAYPGSEGTLTVLGDDEQPVSDGGREDLETDDFTNNAYSQTEAWIYALGATVLVGLSGIVPLFLPIEIDPSAHDERGAAKFNCILSFAVGGLLGDVFIHLLPEAWAHIDHDDYNGQITVGLWVIFGMVLFLSIEKIFGEEEAESSCPKEEQNGGIKTAIMQNGDKATILNGAPSTIANGEKSHHRPLNGFDKNGMLRRKPLNGNSCNIGRSEEMNGVNSLGHTNGGHKVIQSLMEDQSKDTKEKKVKVVGYLNLLANFIDNFTHGIAVAGSFLVSKKVGMLTTAAILLHEVPHEVGDFAILLRSGFSRTQATKSQISTAVGGLLGAVLTLLSESAQETGDRAAWILPFTAGGFIHIALATVLPEILQETSWKESMKQMTCLLCGIAVMGAVTVLIE
ncbi:zinc transporter ZIP13 isoform X1 [Strongylocentrotus purpuratus]|uniref:Zinc transporter ZIP13 n=1 Tax=Strongylocentrotus purpuratus TaxID=7668 RepID=A0A7M7SYS9_STRPU|nr:zinc transporter ZIP13 isoform X1 [Strongylocentrotus purpuratus]